MTALSNVERVKAYLDAQSIPYTDVKELSGGYANWVYLVTQSQGPGLILKHTNVVVKAFPTMQAPIDRSASEANALTVIPNLFKDPGVDVHMPKLIRYDAEAHTQHQLPGGIKSLKDAYAEEALDIPAIGRRMGRWIAALHDINPVPELEDKTARMLYGGSYRNCPSLLERWGLDSQAAQVALDKYAPLLNTEDQNLCHGDFWTGNVLLRTLDEASPSATMVDWEMIRRGNGATDIGQFAAEAWLLDKFRGGRGLLQAFLEAYADASGSRVNLDFVKRAAIHCGIHLAYWPSMVDWADTDGTKKILAYGADLIKEAERGDIAWLKASAFGPLLKNMT